MLYIALPKPRHLIWWLFIHLYLYSYWGYTWPWNCAKHAHFNRSQKLKSFFLFENRGGIGASLFWMSETTFKHVWQNQVQIDFEDENYAFGDDNFDWYDDENDANLDKYLDFLVKTYLFYAFLCAKQRTTKSGQGSTPKIIYLFMDFPPWLLLSFTCEGFRGQINVTKEGNQKLWGNKIGAARRKTPCRIINCWQMPESVQIQIIFNGRKNRFSTIMQNLFQGFGLYLMGWQPDFLRWCKIKFRVLAYG